MKFQYVDLPTKGGTVKKPWIPIRLNYKKTHKITRAVYALLDTGADGCFCSGYIADWLGVNYGKSKEFKFTAANGSEFFTKKAMIHVMIGKQSISCPFFVFDDLPKICPIILGQKGFLYENEIIFNAPQNLIEIKFS